MNKAIFCDRVLNRMSGLLLCIVLAGFALAAAIVTRDSGGEADGSVAASQNVSDEQAAAGGVAPALPPGSGTLAQAPFREKWTGDFAGMLERRTIRALVVFSRTHYFLDGVTQRGIAYDAMQSFEKFVNQRFNNRALKIDVVMIPVSTEQLIPALLEGVGDVALANLTVTRSRADLVDFSDPIMVDAREIIVTGPSAPELERIEDLAGREIHVRRASSYFDSLVLLNDSLRAQGLEPVKLTPVNPLLEDADMLELVNAGVLPVIVVDQHIASVWRHALKNIRLRENMVLRSGGSIAWAMRKESPALSAAVNEFLKTHREGTYFGNMILRRYLKNGKYVSNPLSAADQPRLREAMALLQRYAARYDFDWKMIAAQAYQESRIDQRARSPVGAVGVMQVMPGTAADRNVAIERIDLLENNIHAGVKYLRFLRDRYYQSDDMDEFNKDVFSMASYNMGPARMPRLRAEAAASGLDPDIWFDNVEIVVARRIGQEPVQYVRNILKYWQTYDLLLEDKPREPADSADAMPSARLSAVLLRAPDALDVED